MVKTGRVEVDVTKTRIYLADGRVDHYDDAKLAHAVYMAYPLGVRAAFRSAGDTSPVYGWDRVDQLDE